MAVGNATARAISFRARDPRAYFYEGSGWFTAFVGGSHEFLTESGARDLDARTMFHYPYTAVTPAMTMEMVGIGSQYGVITVDSNGNYLDGSRSYSLTLPAGIPAKDFWSFVNYDPADSIDPADTDYCSAQRQQPERRGAGERRWQRDRLVRTRATARESVKLGSDGRGQRLVHGP